MVKYSWPWTGLSRRDQWFLILPRKCLLFEPLLQFKGLEAFSDHSSLLINYRIIIQSVLRSVYTIKYYPNVGFFWDSLSVFQSLDVLDFRLGLLRLRETKASEKPVREICGAIHSNFRIRFKTAPNPILMIRGSNMFQSHPKTMAIISLKIPSSWLDAQGRYNDAEIWKRRYMGMGQYL